MRTEFIRVGDTVLNRFNVIDVELEAGGGVKVRLVGEREHLFTGEEADAVRCWFEQNSNDICTVSEPEPETTGHTRLGRAPIDFDDD